MKVKNLLMMMVATVLLSVGNLFAQPQPGDLSSICDWAFTPAGGTAQTGGVAAGPNDAFVRFSWETLPSGLVQIGIFPHEDNPLGFAAFRSTGFPAGNAPWTLTVNGSAQPFGNYFSMEMSSDETAMLLTPLQNIPDGTTIRYSGAIYYKTNGGVGNGNDLYPNITFPVYTYGYNCTGVYAIKLPAPTSVAVDVDGVLTFDEVSGADQYVVTISLGGVVIKTQTVTGPGETLSAPLNGVASVTVKASDSSGTNAISDMSAPASWTIDNPDQVVGSSSICEAQFGDAGWGLFISIETATVANGSIQEGDIIFTLSGVGAGFREQGARLASMTVAGIPATNVLTKVGGNLANPNVFRPISGITIPKGTAIVYDGEFEASSAVNGNIWGGRVFNYEYGSACTAPQLDPPTDLDLDGNILTFTPDPNAASTTVYIMSGGNILTTIPTFSSGYAINFPFNGTFTVQARSITGSASYLNSELSAGIPFVVNIPDGTNLPISAICDLQVNTEAGGSGTGTDGLYPNVTVETQPNGEIHVTIQDPHVWRNAGMKVDTWVIAGIRGSVFLEKTSTSTANPQVFRPIAGLSIPKGTVMTTVCDGASAEWGPGNGWRDGGPFFTVDYIYGTTCEALPDVFDSFNPNPSGEVDNQFCWTVLSEALANIDLFEVHTNPYVGETSKIGEVTPTAELEYCFDVETGEEVLKATTDEGTYVVAAILTGGDIVVSDPITVQLTPTGISTPVVAKEVVKAQFFTIDGRAVTAPKAGIYLIKKTFVDGSVKTEKALVK